MTMKNGGRQAIGCSEETSAQLASKYLARKKEIEERLLHFESLGKLGGRALFEELAFCILTPQSKAFSCDAAIRELKQKGLLFAGDADAIGEILSRKTRFHNKKAEYLVLARDGLEKGDFGELAAITFGGSEKEARLALLKSVKGIGWKEASHYLRNVGRGNEIAILDRHILKNLKKHGAIGALPKSLTKRRYLDIEEKMREFCKKRGVPMAHLDLLFWAEETGKVFK